MYGDLSSLFVGMLKSLKIHMVRECVVVNYIVVLCYHAAGWNDWLYQWIAYSDWEYSRPFDLPDLSNGEMVMLKVEGLDTVATIR